MKERLVPAAIIPAIMDLAIKNRLNMEKILQRANVDLSVEQRAGAFLSVTQQMRILDAAYEVTGDPAFGLVLGEAIQYHSLDLVGQLIATSQNIQEALDELFQFKNLITPFTEFSLTTVGADAVLRYQIDTAMVPHNLRVHYDLVASTVVSIANALVADRLKLKRVRFSHAPPEYLEDYQRVFGDCVEFHCSHNEIVFDRDQLGQPLLTSYPDYHEGVRVLAAEKLRSIESRESLSAKVSYLISRNLGTGSGSLEDVAEHFNMTARTLQRKLKQEHTSFVALRDACRHERALRDLADPGIDIDGLAELLGFSDTSNFYHAFKRWQGISPGAYRKRVLAERDG
ncbi:AraC family transcriptional regulator [Ketobacter sp.]|uniref:AraC family transcriptional regulator n=1 Tax=Ketobacter sp. TaxID=2083498 RepID=UPI000F151B22|nr:AraC family transcriptional regulator [Ketobacter sp.]RLU01544.1 MAG: AraC family transcriptional regulator [Ketobacter sp.]